MTIANAVASSSWDEEDVICLGSGSSDDVIDVDDNSGNMDLEDEEPDEYTAMIHDWDLPYIDENAREGTETSLKGKKRSLDDAMKQQTKELDSMIWIRMTMNQWSEDLHHRIQLSRLRNDHTFGGATATGNPERDDGESAIAFLETLNVRSDLHSDVRFQLGDEVIDRLRPVVSFLHSLSVDPYSFKFEPHPEVTKVTAHEVRLVGSSALYYIRQLEFRSQSDLVNATMSFIQQYPYRVCEMLRILIGVGVDMPTLDFALSMAGLMDTTAADVLSPKVLAAIQSRGPITRTSTVSILYGGCTLASTVQERANNDARADDGRLWPDFFRHTQEYATLQLWKFEKPLRYPALGVLDFRSCPYLGETETAIITAIGYGLNAESGGYRDRFDAPPTLCLLFETAMSRLSPRMPGHDEGHHLVRKISGPFQSYRSLVERDRRSGRDMGPPISDRAFNEAVGIAQKLQMVGETVVGVTIADDCPEEAFNGRIGGPFSRTAGRAFDTLRRMLHGLYGTSPTGDLSSADITSYFGPLIDLSGMTLPSPSRWQSNIGFVKSYLNQVKPTVVFTLSAITATVFFHKEGMKHFEHQPQVMTTMSRKAYNDILGKPAIIHTGPGKSDTAIGFPLRHPGQIKYRPAIARHLKIVHLLGLMLAHVLRGVVSARLLSSQPSQTDADQRLKWLTSYVNAYKGCVDGSGLLAKYTSAVEELRAIELGYMRIQQQGIVKRGGPQAKKIKNLVASSLRDREQQINDIVMEERDRATRGLPPDPHRVAIAGASVDSDLWRSWAMTLKPGADMVGAANFRGRTALHRTRNRPEDRSARMLPSNDTNSRPSHGDRARAAAAPWREKEREVAEKRIKHGVFEMAKHLAKLSNVKFDILTDSSVVTKCPRCGEQLIMLSLRQKTHRCAVAGDVYISAASFPTAKRLVHAHDIVRQELATDHVLADIDGLSRHDAVLIMHDAGVVLPRTLPQETYFIWVHNNDSTPLHRLVVAADKLVEVLGSKTEGPNQWEEPNLKMAVKALRSVPFPTAQFNIPRCPIGCGFVSLLPSGSYLKHQHLSSDRKQGVLKADISVRSLWDLPLWMARRLLVEHLVERFAVAPWLWSFTEPFRGKDR